MPDKDPHKHDNKTIHTTCAYCGVGCGIAADVKHSTRTITIQGLDNHPANFGKLCSKGSSLADTLELNSRLLNPEINGAKVTWDTALDAVANGFKETIQQYGPDAVAFYLSGQLLTEDYYVANKLMKGFLGSANIDTNSRLCMSSSVMGHKLAFGTDTVPGCYEDFEQAELIILVGSNTIWCHPVLYQRILRHKQANPHVKIIVIDPRRTQTCDIADLHLPLALGSDTWLFNGLLHYLSTHNKIDHEYVENFCQGLAESLGSAKLSSPSITATADACNVEESLIQSFFEMFANTEKTITLYSQGVNQSSSGTDKVNAIINCHLVTNRIGRPGMGPFSITGQPNAMGGREVGGLANTLAAHLEFSLPNLDRVKRFWESYTPDTKLHNSNVKNTNVVNQPGLSAVDLFDAIAAGKIKAVWIMATNPAVSLPAADKVKQALQHCPLVVVSDCIANTDTLALATIKLPATGWSEKDGTVTNSERCISRQRQLLPPAGKSKHDWWIISQVAQRLGFKEAFNYRSASDIFREHAALSGFENNAKGLRRDFDISALKNISHQEYEDLQPFQWPLNAANPKGSQRIFGKGDFFTPNRRANIIAITPRNPVNPTSSLFPFKLNTGRIRDQWHTMTRTGLAVQLNQHIKEPYIELHPDDAEAKSFQEGELLWIKSQWGKMLARLNITDSVNPGECFAPIHWSDQNSHHGRVGPVTNPAVDPGSFQPESKHTPVELMSFKADWYGLLLQRNPTAWPEADYCVEVNCHQHTHYILAGKNTLVDPLQQMQAWIQTNLQCELLTYEDSNLGHYRLAALDAAGKLQAMVMLSKRFDLPEPTWLGLQFAQDIINQHTRSALLSGRAPAGEDIGRIICACHNVGEKTIANLIKEKNIQDVEGIGRLIKAGTKCGSCIPEIKAIINRP